MKKLKYILAGIVLGLSSLSVQAQEKEKLTAEERANKQTEHMASELGLTSDQKEKIASINLGVVQKNEAIRNNTTMSDELKRSSIQQNNEARKAQFKTILTADQWTKMEEIEKAQKEKRKEIKKVDKPAKKMIIKE